PAELIAPPPAWQGQIPRCPLIAPYRTSPAEVTLLTVHRHFRWKQFIRSAAIFTPLQPPVRQPFFECSCGDALQVCDHFGIRHSLEAESRLMKALLEHWRYAARQRRVHVQRHQLVYDVLSSLSHSAEFERPSAMLRERRRPSRYQLVDLRLIDAHRQFLGAL